MLTETTQGQAAAPFPFRSTEVTRLDISGGIWHNVEGNSITLHNCKVFVTKDGKVLQSSPLPSTHPGSVTKKASSLRTARDSSVPTKAFRTRNLPSASTPNSPASVSPSSAEFAIAMSKLENINQLICPETVVIGIFKRIEPYLRDLETLVAFASTAYTACGSGTSLGHTIKAAIDTRMKKCNIVLSQLLLRIARSPYRSFPCTGHAYCVVHEWWTANELEEIRTIRLSVSEEVTAIGEWLRCLHSFWWASGQFILGASTFTMAGLRDFLESGPIAMLRQVAVEEVTFLEPLKGQRLSIPIQIVSTFEDVHMAITMACHGTAASRFVQNRQYQLNESSTDAPVDEGDILRRFKECKEFEITIVLSRLDILSNVCPGCNRTQPDCDAKSSGWVKCSYCHMKFNASTFEFPEAKIENSDALLAFDAALEHEFFEDMAEDQVSRSTHTETSLGIDLTTNQVIPENSNDSWIIDAQDAKLFRRIIFQSHPPDFPIATISESTPWPIPPGSQSQPSADYPIIHPLLNAEHSRHDFFFDLANPMFVPCRVVGPSGEMVPITAEELFQPACHPPIYNLKVTSEKLPDEWAIEMAYQPQGHPSPEAHLPTSPNATGQPPITVGDVLLQTHRALHLRITHDDWNALDTADERKITKAFYTRCNAGGQSQRDWLVSQGVKRVDYLLEKRLFKGLVRTGTTFDELKLITAKDSFAIGSFAIGSFANRNVARRSSA